MFDKGWNDLRERIFVNQKRLGVTRPSTQLTPWPDGQPEFGGARLPEMGNTQRRRKEAFHSSSRLFAAYVAYTDNEIGRVIQEVKDQGKLDNTLIIYIVGDNGTSAEGSTVGTPFDMAAIHEGLLIPVADQLKYYDAWGSAADNASHVCSVVVGLRYAIQVDQADRVALWRYPSRHGRSHGPATSTTSAASALQVPP